MKLPEDSLITHEKLTQYLLISRKRNDKSQWLAQAGYSLKNRQKLKNDLRVQILPLEAMQIESTKYGQMCEIRGKLTGPNGKSLSVCTIWLTETETKSTKFITMYPDKGDIRK